MTNIETVRFPPNAVVFKEGDKPDGVYFIMSGGVEISRTEGITKVPLAKFGPDSVFGEMALIDSQPRSATVMTLAPTECMKGTSENFANLLNSLEPDVKAQMTQIVSIIRERNKARKAQMTPADAAQFNALKQKAETTKKQILANPPLLEKIKKLDPFLNGVFNSLLRLLVT